MKGLQVFCGRLELMQQIGNYSKAQRIAIADTISAIASDIAKGAASPYSREWEVGYVVLPGETEPAVPEATS